MASTDSGSPSVQLAAGLEPQVSDWEKATAAVLRKTRKLADDAPDSDVWAALTRTTLDGIGVSPLGTPALSADLPATGLPGSAPFTRGATTDRGDLPGWDVRAWFTDPDVAQTAADVVTDLENGVNSLWITVGEAGVPASALAQILEPVFLDLAPVVVQSDEDPLGAAEALAAVLTDKAVTAHPATSLGVTDLDFAVQAADLAGPLGIRAFTVDATAVHDHGASDVQELSYSLLVGAKFLRALDAEGITPDKAAALVEFRYAATDEQFTTIAKFRAARRLWNRVLELSGVTAARGQAQHAVTSRPMLSKYDPYVNMLRTTVASFAAGVGGAESVTVLPFDEPLGLPDAFSRRIARNTSTLLIAESHVAVVADPAGGSHAVEKLTDDLARAAWDLFGQLEADAVDLDELIAATVAERDAQVAHRTRPLTGVSEFPNLAETLPERKPYSVAPQVLRYGHAYEALRDAPAATPVFLATLGTIAQHTARATFATNLLAAGGVGVVVAGATANVDELLAAHAAAGKPAVAFLAGPDALYAEWGAEAVAALRAAGVTTVALAGKAKAIAAEVDADAYVGADALAFLTSIREALA